MRLPSIESNRDTVAEGCYIGLRLGYKASLLAPLIMRYDILRWD